MKNLLTTLAVVALLGVSGCAADTNDDDDGSTDEGEATSSAVSNLSPCPPCTSASGCVGPICVGVRKGKVGCKIGTPYTSKKSTVDPSKYIYSSTCTEWWDQTSGEEQSFSRTCTQRSTKGIDEVTTCNAIAGTSSAQWVTTVYATAAVKRTRGEVQTNYVVPTETVTPWSAWKKQ